MRMKICILALLLLAFSFANAAAFTLDIFGNANMDDAIDENDVAYVKGIIEGTNKETELADANYDGKVDADDITQIELIIRGEDKKLTLIDDSGKTVTINKPVEKIVTVYNQDAVRALGASDMIVGVDEYIAQDPYLYPDLSQKPNIGSSEMNIERIIGLDPDVVIASIYASPDILDDHLNDTDIQVVRIYPRNEEELSIYNDNNIMWASIPEDMLKLGYVLGKVDKAKEYVEWYDSIVTPIKEKVSQISEENKPKVFTEDDSRGGMVERTSSAHIMGVETAGANMIAPGEKEAPDRIVSVEWIIKQNPDVYVARIETTSATGGYSSDDETGYKAYYDEIMGLPGFENINAVKNNQVHIITGAFTYRTSLPVGIAYQAKWYYPELFADLDPEALHQEYIDRFCPGLDFNVSEHGVFVYPPE